METPVLELLLRATARTSLVCFLLYFMAEPIAARWPGPFAGWLGRTRDRWWLALAASHTVHLGLLLTLHARLQWREVDAGSWLGGALAYAVIYLFAAGIVFGWKPLRSKFFRDFAPMYVWFVFLFAFGTRALAGQTWYAVPAGALVYGFVLRLVWLFRREQSAVSSQ